MARAVLFGSIGTLVETSELQRTAYNAAFAEAGLSWFWDTKAYRQMLKSAGGQSRLTDYAATRNDEVNVPALHLRKTELFMDLVSRTPLALRPGVSDVLESARRNGVKTALVTTTSKANVTTVLRAGGLSVGAFDTVIDRSHVEHPKPAPDAYERALLDLHLVPADAMAIEDNPDGVSAAVAAGLECIAFPGAMHDHSDFINAPIITDTLSPEMLLQSPQWIQAAE